MDVATNGRDFLGLNIGSGSRGFGGRGEWRGGSSGMHVDQVTKNQTENGFFFSWKRSFNFYEHNNHDSFGFGKKMRWRKVSREYFLHLMFSSHPGII